jgi:hypothetical protein
MNTRWNGTGEFIIMLGVGTQTGDIEKMFLYSDVMPNDLGTNVPKYSITDTVSTIPFADFINISDLGGLDTSNSGELDGIWKKGDYEITIDGGTYVMKVSGTNYGKGTFSYRSDTSAFTFQSTHEWTGSAWSPNTRDRTNGRLTYNGGNTLTISNLDNYTFLAGTWTRQSSSTSNTDPKTINITGFPGSDYSGKLAMIMLSPSFASLAREEISAVGATPISGTNLNFPLFSDVNMNTRWNGTGEFIIMLGVGTQTGDIEKMFLYSDVMPNNMGTNVPKYSITGAASTIPFTDFIDITDMIEQSSIGNL